MAFAKDIQPWMEQQDWIAGYNGLSFDIRFPQGYTDERFFEDGSLTARRRRRGSAGTGREGPARG
ncbi:MAG TPA: hypothetical protein DCS43_13185 [Verrucomicrobia bacterium]|nr:hypothetical protein [Verrucomicrobiota bacterium]